MRYFRGWICLLLLLAGCKAQVSQTVIEEDQSSEVIVIEEVSEISEEIEAVEENRILIYLDAGHGGMDSGAVKNDVLEKDINLLIVQKLLRYLQQDFDVIVSRDEDVSCDLSEKAQQANENHADVYVAIHQNIHTNLNANGIEVWYNSEKGEENKQLALMIEAEAVKQTGATERGIWDSKKLVCLTETEMMAVLVETGFISNEAERSRLLNEDYQDQIAYGIYLGLLNYFCEVEK